MNENVGHNAASPDSLGVFDWHPIAEEPPRDQWVFVYGRLENGDGFDRFLEPPKVQLAYPMRSMVTGEVDSWLSEDCYHLINRVTHWARVRLPAPPTGQAMEALRG